MPSLFGVDVKKVVADATKGQLVAGTLTETVTDGTRSGDITAGQTQTKNQYTFEGILDNYKDYEIDGTVVQAGDRRVLVIAGSMSAAVVPEPNWDVTIEGTTYRVINVGRDPAEATYTLQVRSA